MAKQDMIVEPPAGSLFYGNGYVYINVESSYDPSVKYTRSKRLCIGKNIDNKTMHANKNYISMFAKDSLPDAPERSDLLAMGMPLFLKKAASDCGLDFALLAAFDTDEANLILDLAAYTLSEETDAFQHFPAYGFHTALMSDSVVSDSTISRFLQETIKPSATQHFLDEWSEQNAGEGRAYLCYDSTNINCIADGVSLAEMGHAKDDPSKPQDPDKPYDPNDPGKPADPDQPSDGDGTGDTPVVDPEDPNGGTQTPENPGGGTEIPDAPVDYGTFSVEAPSSIYSNYAGKEIKVTFSNPDYATEVTYVTDNANVFVENGKIYATGVYEEAFSVTVTASTQYHEAQTFTVNVSTFTGDVQAETKVQYYEEYIIKEENKGGIIFVGDSYFDGYKIEKPPFWSDFYSDFPNEKAFLMGISSSQIDDLEVVSERIVYPMEPKEIVVHIGFNDVHHGPLTVDELYARITALCEKYKEALPDVKIYFIGVEPKKNGYTAGTAYYNSSTVKAPELTARIKEYAESKDWFTYVDTMSVFVDSNGVIKQSSYLSTDLSHPTLAAYDEIRAILNEVRGVENYVPSITDDPNAHYIKNYGVGGDINSVGKYYTAADGSALTNNYIISGTLTVTASNASAKPHIQFRFSQGFRFLLWDADMDGKLGAGYIATGLTTKNDKTPGAVLFDATSELTLNWSIVVDNGKAYWFINNTLLEKFDSPTLQYFNVGALEMDLAIYDVDLTVKSENEEEYNARFAEYNKIIMAVADPNALLINSYGNSSNINGTGKNYTDANGAALTNNYAIKGTLAITAINKSNAHLQFRFSSGYRFLLWDSSNDGVLGAGYTATGLANKNDKTAGAALFDANSLLVLDWAVVVNNGKAYWYINGTLMETFDNPVLEFFNIGALQMNVAVYNVELAVKSENETAYNAFLSEYGIK